MNAHDQIQALYGRMCESIIGQERVVQRILIGLLANGNLLVEGLPGLAKTRAIKALANNIQADFSRIQFTPDLLPSDVTGTEIFHQGQTSSEFRFEAGPIFANIVLGDEINRAPAKVQAAMLEAMEERQVTIAGKSHQMPELFMVMATQNPVEQEGTYPLPEAQLDRFLMHVKISYPSVEDEVKIVELVRKEEQSPLNKRASADQGELTTQQSIFQARDEISQVHVSDALVRYIADLIYASRTPEAYDAQLARWIEVGASPRASLALDKCSRAHAWLHQRDFVDPVDVQAVAHDVLRHRLVLSYEAQAEDVASDALIDSLVEKVALP
ncbi:MAG: MoxR family ATPase [Pseudomonadota bacterium]